MPLETLHRHIHVVDNGGACACLTCNNRTAVLSFAGCGWPIDERWLLCLQLSGCAAAILTCCSRCCVCTATRTNRVALEARARPRQTPVEANASSSNGDEAKTKKIARIASVYMQHVRMYVCMHVCMYMCVCICVLHLLKLRDCGGCDGAWLVAGS